MLKTHSGKNSRMKFLKIKLYFTFVLFFLVKFSYSTDRVHIFTYGDSHSHWHSNILELVNGTAVLKTMSMYGKTMHGIIQLGSNGINFRNTYFPLNSIAMFNFGEVDSRNHLHKFAKIGVYKKIKCLVADYENLILRNANLVPHVIIWIGGLVPPKDNPNCAHIGNNYDRALYNRLLNDELKRMAYRNDFFFLDNYEDYATDDGFLNWDLSDFHIHIGSQKFTLKTKSIIANEIRRTMFKGKSTLLSGKIYDLSRETSLIHKEL